MIDVTDGITSIEVAPDEIRHLVENGFVNSGSLERPRASHHATGARVTVGFTRSTPIPPNSEVRLYYDIAENGGLRLIVGVPLLTHTTVRQGYPGTAYRYRLSHWIAAPSVMWFIPPECAAACVGWRAGRRVTRDFTRPRRDRLQALASARGDRIPS